MPHAPLEFVLALAYSLCLALIALSLEVAARHAHRRTLRSSTIGFTYHKDRDIWQCPEDRHLFPVFADHAKGTVVYRAPASACNSCRSKEACTDSNHGRTIERYVGDRLEFGMQRFHRGMSITLLGLACLILIVEFFRIGGLYPRLILAVVLVLFSATALRLSRDLRSSATNETPESRPGRNNHKQLCR